MSSQRLDIAIVGGGPAGLTLGLLLQKRNIPFIIFELRQKPTEEQLARPAGSLDLHEDTGLAALRECGLYDKFMTLTGDCTEAARISDKQGNILYAEGDEAGERPEVSRNELTKLLFSSLPPHTIRWGHKLRSAALTDAMDQPKVRLDFGEHGIHNFDIVVGADGAWSKVRPLVTNVKPHYTGVHVITTSIRTIATAHQNIHEFIGNGTFSCLGDKHGIILQRSTHGSAIVYIFISTADEGYAMTSGLADKTVSEAKDYLLGDSSPFVHWGSKIKDILAIACQDQINETPNAKVDIKALHSLPVGYTWDHHPNATLIGDAAHLLNPGAGEGVNLAMKDSLTIANAISKAYGNNQQDLATLRKAVSSTIENAEMEIVKTARESAQMTLVVNEAMFGNDDGATGLTNFFKSFAQPEE